MEEQLGTDSLSIALIGPDEDRRKAAVTALAGCRQRIIREYSSYPSNLGDVPKLLEPGYDVIILDLDSYSEYALELVECICAKDPATVMVYSERGDSELLVRSMRAGAREFLTMPFAQSTLAESLIRASARRPATRPAKKAGGRLLAFLGAKGGDGVTTLACNFAVSLAKESEQSTVLIDLNLPLGDAALNLGVKAEYSTINALESASRLDGNFLSTLLVKHSSGVSVLAAPGKFPQYDASDEAIDKLLSVARHEFDNVVIDMGTRLDLMGTSLFKSGSTIYLVIQAGIAGLRNSNRMISQYFATEVPRLEIVLNRYHSRAQGVGEDQITKALTRPAQWKIPNDYNAVRRMQHTAVPLALEDSPISRLIRQMARSACGLPALQEKEKMTGFGLKKFGRGISGKASSDDDGSGITQLGLTSERNDDDSGSERASSGNDRSGITRLGLSSGWNHAGATAEATEPEPPVKRPAKRVYASAPAAPPDAETPMPQKPTVSAEREEPVATKRIYAPAAAPAAAKPQPPITPPPPIVRIERTEPAASKRAAVQSLSVSKPGEAETRTYKGATYEKGADGKWHLRRSSDSAAKSAPAAAVSKELPAITWAMPAPIAHGSPLSAAQLNAEASVAGRFAYTPAEGDLLAEGTHTLTAVFTPADIAHFLAVQASVPLTVIKAIVAITWPTPAAIAYGTALSSAQLNAKASVPGRFVYTPGKGTMLAGGAHTLTADFIPADTTRYTRTQATVSLVVTKETPGILWPAPAPIAHGTALGITQFRAMASVPGKFVFNPAIGEVLPGGTHTLTAIFTPTDAARYSAVQATVPLTVTRGTPEISWPTPASITYGDALGSEQLNAVASVPGRFAYSPGAGKALTAGVHTLTATFTPENSDDYIEAQASITLTVTRAMPAIAWPPLAPIHSGTALGAAQLNATASAPGSFDYAPVDGGLLPVGVHTLTATFTPEDAENYTEAQATATLTVTRATPTAAVPPKPAPVSVDASELRAKPEPVHIPAVPVQVQAVAPAPEAISAPEVAPIEDPTEPPVEIPVQILAQAPVQEEIQPSVETPVQVLAQAPEAIPAPEVAPAEELAKPPVEAPVQVQAPAPKFVIEGRSELDSMGTIVFPDGTTIYLAMQPGSAGEQESKRLVAQFFSSEKLKPEIMLNQSGERAEADLQAGVPASQAKPASKLAAKPASGKRSAKASASKSTKAKKKPVVASSGEPADTGAVAPPDELLL